MAFEKAELERYSRHILAYGIQAQERINQTKVAVIGAGGIGTLVLPLLAASGVGSIHFFDHDSIEQSNLGRQFLYKPTDVGSKKAKRMSELLHDINPHVNIYGYDKKFLTEDFEKIASCSFILDGSDSISTKLLVNRLILKHEKEGMIAALGRDQAHVMVIEKGQACYECLFTDLSDETEIHNCAAEGILSPFPSVVASQMTNLLIRRIINGQYDGKLYIFEKSNCRNISIQKKLGCKICNKET